MRKFLVPKRKQSHIHKSKLKKKKEKKKQQTFHQPLQGKGEKDLSPSLTDELLTNVCNMKKFHEVKLNKVSLKTVLETVIVCIIASTFLRI